MKEEKTHLLDDHHKNNKKLVTTLSVLTVIFGILALVLAALLTLFLVFYLTQPRENKCPLSVSNLTSQNLYMHSAIASDAIPCASVANYIMAVRGGNAVDGAIAGVLCTCAVNFHSCGIGGGSFVLIYNKTTGKTEAIDIRESAPGKATEDMYADNKAESLIGGKSIAVMGFVSGYYEIHKKMGKLDWSVLFEPTIDLLQNGFYISKSIETAILYFFRTAKGDSYNELRSILTNPVTGKPKMFGEMITNLKLAKTLFTLSFEPYAMQNGSLVDAMISEITAEGGIITKDDLKNYEAKWREPISVKIDKNRTLYTLPPPSSGAIVAFGINVLSNYNFGPNFLDSCENTGLFFHRLIETMKFGFGKRSALGDIDFINDISILKNLTSDSYAKWVRSLITDDKTHPVNYYYPEFEFKEDHGTSHFSLIGPDGDAVSITSTINYLFGSLVMGSVTGILYNDQMDDFSTPNQTNAYKLPPSPSNFIKPQKRPMSSMSPIIIVDTSGNVELVLGASGGSQILSGVTQMAVLAELLDKSIKESIDAARVHHQLLPNKVLVEDHFPEEISQLLRKRGHIVEKNSGKSIGQGIKKSADSAFWECGVDYRKMGLCDGF